MQTPNLCKYLLFISDLDNLLEPKHNNINKMSGAVSNLLTVLKKLGSEYMDQTPQRLKIVDSFLAYVMFTGIFQVGHNTPEYTLLYIYK